MFVPSKIGWTESFHGVQMRTWAVVLATAAITHFASGIAGWVIGVRLARRRVRELHHWRMLIGWLLVQHLTWSIWIVLAFQGETRFLLISKLTLTHSIELPDSQFIATMEEGWLIPSSAFGNCLRIARPGSAIPN